MINTEISHIALQNPVGAIVITSITAIIVVFLNQIILSNRAKKELMIKKVKELFLASTEYVNCCDKLLIWIQENKAYDSNTHIKIPSSLIFEVTESINKLDMICNLYFKGQSFKVDEYRIENMPIIGKVKSKIRQDEWENAFTHSRHHINASRNKLHNICKALVNSHGY